MLVKKNYTHSEGYRLLMANCRAFAQEFPDELVKDECEFFFHIKINEPDRYVFIRVNTKDREKFMSAISIFAENMDFEILSKNETKILLNRIKIDTYE